MRSQTNLVARGSVYQFRKKVPADLRGIVGPKSGVIRKSLGQGLTLAQAKAESARLASQWEQTFDAERKKLQPRPLVRLTSALVPRLTQSLHAHILRADEEIRAEGLDEEGFSWRLAANEEYAAVLRRAYARGDDAPARAPLDDWLAGLGIEADHDSPEARQLRREFLKAQLRATESRLARDRGELVETPEAPTAEQLAESIGPAAVVPKATNTGHTLTDVVTYWKGTADRAKRTIAAAETLLREFEDLHGKPPLLDVSKAHFIALRDKMLERVKPATVQSRFNLLRAAFTVCLQDDQLGLTTNPLQHVVIRNAQSGAQSYDAFSADQLQALFDSDVFTKGTRPEGGRGEAAYWAPLLALFTGARREEVLSLRLDQVYAREGVNVLHFLHRPELGQRLKGKNKNARRVPVHPELVRLGFLRYVESVKGRGPWLFPDIDRSEKEREFGSAWGAWFGRYLQRLGIKSERLTFHSFRHTFKHYARASGLPEDHQDAMTGHTTAEVARRYGSCEGYPVGPLAESMRRLQFGKLDLSRLSVVL